MDKQTNEVARENSFLKLKLILNESQCHKLLHIFNDKKIASKILLQRNYILINLEMESSL